MATSVPAADNQTAPAYAFQDLTNDPLLSKAPRMDYAGAPRPSLGGIPLLAKIGQGGMGAVYYGLHPVMGVAVAVKVLPLHLVGNNPDMAKRFVREAQIAGSINSANLIYVRNVGEDSGYFYQVMEYVRGVSAGAYLKLARKSGRVGLPETEALEICVAAATGLAAAHAKNIIHRDIKPDNILIPTIGETRNLRFSAAKVADLGLARTQQAESAPEVAVRTSASREGGTLTGAGQAMGTLGYMPPEQIDDAKSVGKTADVFALGATLYALLAGHAPFEGDTSMERQINTALGKKDPIAKLRPDMSQPTATFIDRCLEIEPDNRYADGAQALKVLERCLAALKPQAAPADALVLQPVSQQTETHPSTFLAHEPPALAPAVTPLPHQRPESRPASWLNRRALIAASVALVLLAAGGLAFRNWQQARADRAARAAEAARIAAEEKTKADEARAAAEQRKADEDARKATVARWATEAARKAAAKEKAEREAEAARVAQKEKAGREAEASRLAAEKKRADERARLWDGKETIADYAKRMNLPATQVLDLGKGVKLELVLVPAGKFVMGSPDTEKDRKDDETQHEVTITQPFYMGKYEVTQEQYEAVTGKNQSLFKGAENPVETVSWDDAQQFCGKASAVAQSGGLRYTVRLPTEAEWEYACRSGMCTEYYTGDGEVNLNDAGWHSANSGPTAHPVGQKKPNAWGLSGRTTHPVGQKKPNAWGLCDMHGNVWEWCQDWYEEGYYKNSPTADPPGAANGAARVLRGGSWNYVPRVSRSANRNRHAPDDRGISLGFRVVVGLAAGAAAAPETQPDAKAVQPDTASVKPETKPWPLHDGKEPIAAYAKRANLPPTQTLDLGKGVKLELVLIPPGKFLMGSPETEKDRGKDETQHEVAITKPFYMGVYEVTQEQYQQVVGKNPSNFKSAQNPVERVSWEDAQEFCRKANAVAQASGLRPQSGGLRYVVRLPTAAEWEYACRAGTTTRFYTGDGDDELTRAGWYGAYSTPVGNSAKNTNPVGGKEANRWGLCDMHGNVWEWCQDWYGGYAAGAATDPQGPAGGTARVLRGGSWNSLPRACRSAFRYWFTPDCRYLNFGFRVVVARTP